MSGPGGRRGRGGPRYPPWLALPALGWYAAFFLAPLGFVVAYSFAQLSGFVGVEFAWNLDNYRYLWDPLYRHSSSAPWAWPRFGTVVTLLVGFPFAYWLARYAAARRSSCGSSSSPSGPAS